MTREHATDKDNPATDPERQNAQGKHEGVPHRPEEFDAVNPAKQVRHPAVPRGHKPDTAMCEDRDRPGIVDKSEDC
ncbi:hypothetical protein [Paracoccus thiocyanatus]|uniref:Uncharacterized protein n=1 Tax=Paracoccus thiocyanatus TaxID=34006 RepID=A0A3D8PCE3_9RHOB|nr:hypothetical protein [Paracoccus thiocyanatus]RDW13744.1 hypothetical protein DIE28_06355 [Paracoccus thiocyanatus]